jgi:hypothetical protein
MIGRQSQTLLRTDKDVTSSVLTSHLAADRLLQGGYPERLSRITLEWPMLSLWFMLLTL